MENATWARLFRNGPSGSRNPTCTVCSSGASTACHRLFVEAAEQEHIQRKVRTRRAAALMVGVVTVAPAVEVELDRLGVEGDAVVEPHTLPQPEGVGAPTVLGFGHLGGQRGHQVGAFPCVLQKCAKDVARHVRRGVVRLVDGVERDRIDPLAEDEGAAGCSLPAADRLFTPATHDAEQRGARQARTAQPHEFPAAQDRSHASGCSTHGPSPLMPATTPYHASHNALRRLPKAFSPSTAYHAPSPRGTSHLTY